MKPFKYSPFVLMSVAFVIGAVVFLLSLPGCSADEPDAPQTEEEASGLTDFEMEHGLGPITEPVSLEEEIDGELAAQGEDIFQTKCESCHQMDSRFVGPPLGNVLEARSAEFVMNFMLNPQEMIREHPVGQQLLQEYMTEMPYQNVSEEDARAILEYLRTELN